jgi:hypothetical protein
LFDRDSIRRGVYTNVDGKTQTGSATSNFSSQFIKVKPNTIYSITMFEESYENGSLYGIYYDEYKNGINQSTNILNLISNKSKTFTTPSNAHYIVFTGYRGSGTDIFTTANTMVCEGTPTTYEPYKGKTYTIQLGNTIYGGELDVLTGELRVTHGEVDLGGLTWVKENTSKTGRYRFHSVTLPSDSLATADTINCIADSFTADTVNHVYSVVNDNSIGCASVTVYITSSVYDSYSENDFKVAMAGKYLVYELAEPYTIQLTPQQIRLLKGTNHLSCNTGDLSIKYYPDNVLGQLKGDIEKGLNAYYDYQIKALWDKIGELQA